MSEDAWDEAVISDHMFVRQRRAGYRFGLDALLLATDLPELSDGATVWELGAGQGAVALSVAAREPGWEVVALERHAGLLGLLRGNIERNDSSARAREGDVRERGDLPRGIAQLVLCNPPYYDPKSRRLSEDGERACARYELHGGLEDFARAAAVVLARRGWFKVVVPPERLEDLCAASSGAGLKVERLRFVHDRAQAEAYLCEVWCRKGGKAPLKVRAPLIVRDEDGRYTPEVASRVAGAAAREPSEEWVKRVSEARR